MDEINIFEYLGIVKRQWKSVAVTTAVTLTVALLYLIVSPTRYEAKTTLILPQSAPANGLLSQLSGIQSLLGSPVQVSANTYVQILKSRRLMQAVTGDLGIEELKIPAKELKKSLDVTAPKEGGIEIVCTASTSWFKNLKGDAAQKRAAQLAADMANAYARQLKDYDLNNSLTSGRKHRIFLEGELAKTRQRLARAENDFEKFRKKNPSVVPVEHAVEEIKALVELRAKQLEASAEREEIGKRLESTISAFSREDQKVIESEIFSDNPAMTTLRQKLAELEVQRATLLENLTEKHPDVVSLDQEIQKTREKMAGDLKERIVSSQTLSLNPLYQELHGQIVALGVNRVGLEAREQAMGKVVGNVEKRISETTGKQMQFVRLMRDVKALETVYATLLGEYSKAQINEARETENFQVLDAAVVPEYPASPKKKLTFVAALACGLLLGTFLAILQDSVKPKNRKLIREVTSDQLPVTSEIER